MVCISKNDFFLAICTFLKIICVWKLKMWTVFWILKVDQFYISLKLLDFCKTWAKNAFFALQGSKFIGTYFDFDEGSSNFDP